jgi:hypothetical protein
MRILLLSCLIPLWVHYSFAQSTPQPTPVPGTNSIQFDSASATYNFSFDGSPLYRYKIKNGSGDGGTFSVLQGVDGTNAAFMPGLGGGIIAVLHGEKKYPWNPGGDVVFWCRGHRLEGKTVHALWTMIADRDSLRYEYSLSITGRTLVVTVDEDSSFRNAVELNLGSADARERRTIGIPYLTLCNVLYSNDGLFTSMFIDWEATVASTLEPLVDLGSKTSGYFSAYARYLERTDGTRNRMHEVVYLTVSPNLEDVLPNVPNPRAPGKSESSRRTLWYFPLPMNRCASYLDALHDRGIRNLWIQLHDWPKWGPDRGFPDIVPARCNHCDWPDTSCNYAPSALNGDSILKDISARCARYEYLFGLHENYVDYYRPTPAAPNRYYSRNDEAVLGDGSPVINFINPCRDTAHVLKPSRAGYYIDLIAPQIHSLYGTSASYLDVHSAANPSQFVDYDAAVNGAGTFQQTLLQYRKLPALLREFHHGPVQGEGRHHFLYTGYFDDLEARVTMAETTKHGYTAPLLVDFDLRKLHAKTLVHGLGNWEQYYNRNFNEWTIGPFSRDSVLSYLATVLAYGHGGFLPTTYVTRDFFEVAGWMQQYVYPMQLVYADANPVSILYNDNGSLKTASQYIRDHPATYENINSPEFMSQVRVEYDNGVVVCVNRNLFRKWTVSPGEVGGWFDYHALISGRDSLRAGTASNNLFTLPVMNGWVCYVPAGLVPEFGR